MDKSGRKINGDPNFRVAFFIALCMINLVSSNAQSELDVKFRTLGGREYNIFKSPDELKDKITGEMLDMDTILISDYLFDLDYGIEYTKEIPGKSLIAIGSDLWYRHYLKYSESDQTRFNTKISYEHSFGEKVMAGSFYEFRWSDRIGSTVTGDLLMRSFRYLGNTGNIFLTYMPGEKFTLDFFSDYEYKFYYSENTLDPLDHGNLSMNASMEFSPSRKHGLTFELEAINRNYAHYHALDSNGRYSRDNPLRNFRYYTVKLDYDLNPVRGFLISPSVKLRRRIDMYQDYYSYISLAGSLRIRYMWDRFYISLYSNYKRMKYDRRTAFTGNQVDTPLIYDYYDLNLTFKYELSRNWEIYFNFESDNRDSNSDLETFRTRRSYNNHAILAGIIYTLPRIKW